jgi:hypothetical protein
MAEFLWSEVRREGYWTDSLRRSVPILASTRDADATTEDLPHREVLGQLASSKDMAVRNEFFNEIRDARDVLRRLRSFGHGTLAEEGGRTVGTGSLRHHRCLSRDASGSCRTRKLLDD